LSSGSFRQACYSTVWELRALSESSFDLQSWLQQQGVSAEQASGRFFCKWLAADQLERLQAEAEGLQALISCAGSLVLPRPLALGLACGRALLVLDWLDLAGGDRAGWERLGRGLAQLHRRSLELTPAPGLFGWHDDRWIGAGIQRGGWQRSWGAFFCQQRLADQFQRLEAQGLRWPQSERLLELLPPWLEQHQPEPCLVHGDLWPGNAGVLRDGRPCLYDPAVSYSDREVDLAMARMFGGLPEAFFAAYNNEWPLPAGAEQRLIAYNLFHLLNHANLFGGSYIDQSRRSVEALLRLL